MEKIKVLLFNTAGQFKILEVNATNLNEYYDALECEILDIARRKVGGKYFDVFVDDMGLFKENPVVTAISPEGEPMLVGNLIFANHNGEGNTVSLTLTDIVMIMNAKCLALDNR